MPAFLKKLVIQIPPRTAITFLLAVLTFSVGELVLRWATTQQFRWALSGPDSVEIQARLAHAQTLQAVEREEGSVVIIVCEEKPVPLLRLTNAEWNTQSANAYAAALQQRDGSRLRVLKFRKLQLTNGTDTWYFPIK